jgi:uncharacterized protein YlxW (UPF0749 family)
MKSTSAVFTSILFIIGFMLAVQFQSTNEPEERETRDIWELRSAIDEKKEEQRMLNNEIQKYEALFRNYEKDDHIDRIKAMSINLSELKERAGITEIEGRGIVITIDKMFSEELLGQPPGKIYPELISRLVNELNMYGAEEIAIDNQRIVNQTAIREVKNETYINEQPLSPLPIKIFITSQDAERLKNEMIVSQSMDDFARENLQLIISDPQEVTLPAYTNQIRINYMEQVKENS